MPPDFEAFYLRHCRAIYRVCFAFLKNASPVQGELLAVRLTEGLSFGLADTYNPSVKPCGFATSLYTREAFLRFRLFVPFRTPPLGQELAERHGLALCVID